MMEHMVVFITDDYLWCQWYGRSGRGGLNMDRLLDQWPWQNINTPPPTHTHTITEQTHNTPKHNSTHTHTLCLDRLSINSQQKRLTETIRFIITLANSIWQAKTFKNKNRKHQQTVPFVQPGLLQLIREVMDAKDCAVTPVLVKISQLLVPNFDVLVSGWHALCHCLRERKNLCKTGSKRQIHNWWHVLCSAWKKWKTCVKLATDDMHCHCLKEMKNV